MAAQVGFDTNNTWVRNRQENLQNTVQHLPKILRRDSNLTHKRIKVQTWGELLILKVCLMIRNPLNSKLLYIKRMKLLFGLRVQNNAHITNRLDGILVVKTQFATQGMEMHIYRARVVLKLLSPNSIQDILARANMVGVLRQVFEQTKLNIGQPHNLRTAHHTMRGPVYDYVSKTIFHQRWQI